MGFHPMTHACDPARARRGPRLFGGPYRVGARRPYCALVFTATNIFQTEETSDEQ